MSKLITTIPEFIEGLGGDGVVAEKYQISRQAISNWKSRNHIATGFHLKFYAEAKRKGLNVCPSIFGLDQDEAKYLFNYDKSFKYKGTQNVI